MRRRVITCIWPLAELSWGVETLATIFGGQSSPTRVTKAGAPFCLVSGLALGSEVDALESLIPTLITKGGSFWSQEEDGTLVQTNSTGTVDQQQPILALLNLAGVTFSSD